MSTRLLAPSGSLENPPRQQVAERLRSGETFWLDIYAPEDDDFGLLRDTFRFHDLAVEDSENFGQRPKAEEYEDFVFLVVYGWSPDEDGLVEVHCFYTDRYLVTVHRDPSPSIDSLCADLERDQDRFRDAPLLLYGVIDILVDDLFPVLQRLDERLDLIEESLFTVPRDTQLGDIFQTKRRLVSLRRVVAPQRDLLGRLVSGGVELPGLNPEMERYFRDVYDHLIRLTEEIDSDRELANSAIDAYLSTASNRLNVTTKQLTVIATIFLPLSFITGFFGQNFGWMVDHVDGWEMFVALGVGLEIVALALLLAFFRVRRWF